MDHQKLLKDLIEIKSYSGEEDDLRNYIQKWFKSHKIDSFVQGKNLILHIEGEDKKKAFIFNSHMDTVSAGSAWRHDPWRATLTGDRLIGLGASDMKSGIAASMLLAEKMTSGKKPPVDLWFTYVEREETDGIGAQSFIKWFEDEGHLSSYTDIAAIFTEPTGLVEVEHGHRGNYFLIAKTRGLSGHASRPDKVDGKMAVKKMFQFSEVLKKEVENWNKEFPNKYFSPSITVGEMTSIMANVKGVVSDSKGKIEIVPGSVNKFPEECIATFDIRTVFEVHNLVFPRISKIAKREGVEVNLFCAPTPAGFTDPKDKIVKVSQNALGKSKLVVSLASADLGFFTAVGINSVILGPGEREQCHMPDEYCYLSKVGKAVDMYKVIVENWAK